MDRIKLRITVVAVLAVFLLKGADTFAQQTDPTLTGAVFAQTSTLKNIYDKRQKVHEKIIAAETAVTVALDRVHSVENKMLEYLSNAQGAMQNLYQIKRAGELVATEIPQNCNLLLKSVGSNLKVTVFLTLAATFGQTGFLVGYQVSSSEHPFCLVRYLQESQRLFHITDIGIDGAAVNTQVACCLLY